MKIFSALSRRDQATFDEMIIMSALYMTNMLSRIFILLAHWNNSPSADSWLGHIIVIPSQPVFALSPKCCMLSGEAINTNLIISGLTWPGLEPTIYHTDAVVMERHYLKRGVYRYWINWQGGWYNCMWLSDKVGDAKVCNLISGKCMVITLPDRWVV
jgi:hypothetical protein